MNPQTRAEATSYRETSLYGDVMSFLAALESRRDRRLHITDFGTSPQGRTLPLVIASADGVTTPAEARAKELPVVLIINGIHGGEVEGKEASLMLLRDLLDRDSDLFSAMTLVIVPLFNADGHESLDVANRALDLSKLEGQIGPVPVGTRTNPSGINLNRDYMRQATKESRLLSAVYRAWNPALTIDTHSTNGSVHRFHMTYDTAHTVESGRRELVDYMRARLLPAVTSALDRNHGLHAGWYGNFVEDERALDARRDADPRTAVGEGWMTYPHHPRFGSNYRGLTNRLDLLLECYSYLPFEERVQTTYATLVETLTFVAANNGEIGELVAQCAAPRQRIAIRYRLDASGTVEIPTRAPRTLDGSPVAVRIPYYGDFVGTEFVERPPAYVMPANVAEHLASHGFAVETVDAVCDVEVATVTESSGGDTQSRKILEAAASGVVDVEWKRTQRRLPAGSRVVRTDVAQGAVAVYFCEPRSDDSAIENGLIAAEAGREFPIWRLWSMP